ncbi:DUF551 domain-containing protein [Klebsiella oxytoca]
MTSKLTRLTDDELTETLRLATSGYPLPACVEGNLRQAFAELQECRKADSDPVAWTSETALADVSCEETSMIGQEGVVGNIPLYRHAQPVSEREQMAIENFRSAMEGIGHIRRTLEETFGGLHGTHVEPDVLAECKAICDAIYAAYGHAQPAPVVPGKWIPVSEWMPENKPGSYEYLVFETLNNRVNNDYWNVPDKGDEAFTPFWNYYGEHVTHWMPLPAAPQEVK